MISQRTRRKLSSPLSRGQSDGSRIRRGSPRAGIASSPTMGPRPIRTCRISTFTSSAGATSVRCCAGRGIDLTLHPHLPPPLPPRLRGGTRKTQMGSVPEVLPDLLGGRRQFVHVLQKEREGPDLLVVEGARP